MDITPGYSVPGTASRAPIPADPDAFGHAISRGNAFTAGAETAYPPIYAGFFPYCGRFENRAAW
ncbi:MAG: hypothetical protein ABS87_01130 [Sphingomonas sp. SCN 67-18]|nr:MAG: hypothetical protein ABS87_01130 [Sphingomonas sp. SCN 67-18]